MAPYDVLFLRRPYDTDYEGNGFSPECVLKCIFKLISCEKAVGHWLQGNGFSPVYV